jgi:hypothetical protein
MARKPFQPKPLDEQLGAGPAIGVPIAGDAAAIAEAESIETDPKAGWTVNGKPIPLEFAHLIDFKMTDQGIAEARAHDAAMPVKASGIRFNSKFDRDLERKAGAEVWDSFDPLREAVDGVREPGMNYRFLSDRAVKRRGRRGWEPVIGENGDPVKVADMVLGRMPEEKAEQRNAHYREVGNERLRDAGEQYELDQAKAIRDAKVRGFAPLRAGETVADNHDHPGMVIETGVRTQRGVQTAL